MACDAATLAKESACINGALSHKQTLAAMLWVLATSNSMSTNPSTLAAEAACIYSALSEKQILAAILYVFCTGSGGGGGGGVTTNLLIISTGVAPTATPTGNAFAYDTSTGGFWAWDGAAWHQVIA